MIKGTGVSVLEGIKKKLVKEKCFEYGWLDCVGERENERGLFGFGIEV